MIALCPFSSAAINADSVRRNRIASSQYLPGCSRSVAITDRYDLSIGVNITEKNLFAIVVEVVAIIERLYPNGLPQKLVGPIATLKAAIEANRKMRVNKFKGVKSPGRPLKVEKRRQIARLLDQGLTRKQIMKTLECGSSIIDSVKKEAAAHNDEVVRECLNDVEERGRRAE